MMPLSIALFVNQLFAKPRLTLIRIELFSVHHLASDLKPIFARRSINHVGFIPSITFHPSIPRKHLPYPPQFSSDSTSIYSTESFSFLSLSTDPSLTLCKQLPLALRTKSVSCSAPDAFYTHPPFSLQSLHPRST